MKINGSVARRALKDLEDRGVIRKVVSHARLTVYSTFFPFLPLSLSRLCFSNCVVDLLADVVFFCVF